MDTFLEMIEAVQSDLSIGDETTKFPLATVKLAINRGYRKAGGLFRWPETEDAKKTTIQDATEYVDYPQNWRPNSVWKLVVNDTDYGDPLAFKDYLYEKENDNPSGQTKMWANQWRRYFVDPSLAEDDVVEIWGQKVVTSLSADGDVTIFSYSMPEANEAIVLEAVAILKNKGEEQQSGQFLSIEAKQILSVAWNKIAKEMSKYERTQPMFNVEDMFKADRPTRKDTDFGRF